MARAQATALESARPDYLCWLNDDVILNRNALDVLLATARLSGDAAAAVGALADKRTGSITYSGYLQMGRRPTQLHHVRPDGRPSTVDTFNGNLVLLPRAVYERIGSIDPRFEHSLGDTDYGFRVRRAGLRSILAPQTLGYCARNSLKGTWRDSRLSLRTRLGLLVSRKGIPPRSYLYYQRRHGGRRWLINVAATYLHALAVICRSRGQADGVG
jgi:GT2 family glycosyltransferase